ncbi:unnamed protein product [Ambrosiozyma monospora]|uniref:Unnamed protein product n=1 Tax=Ambrosiozyma monospora TaxID=43982 RepID=A0ACB5U840_AMBMO|nr:unnamed protein product [Ambrosiozyma monospora]
MMQPPSIEQILSDNDLSGLIYQKFMVEIGKLKQESHQRSNSLADITQSWNEARELNRRLEMFFNQSTVNKCAIASFSAHLLFSSLTRETLDLGTRLQMMMDINDWRMHFRDDCIQLAMRLLTHSTKENLPSYYNKYWIVAQHLIYACLFILLDMLMMKSEEDDAKLNKVKIALQTLRTLKSSHFTANVGVAVIDKLCNLVSLVRLGKTPETVENISLQTFLSELEIANPCDPRSRKRHRVCPPPGYSHLL